MHHMQRTTRRLLIAACSVLILAVWGCSESPMGPGFDAARASETESPEIMATAGSNFVTVLVSATVTAVNDGNNELGGVVSAGDRVQGYYVFDLNAPDTDSRPDRGAYLFSGMPCRMSFHVSGLTFASDPGAIAMDIRLRDNQAVGNPRDRCDITSANNLDVLSGVGLQSIAINLVDFSATALSSDALIEAQTEFADWPTQHRLTFTGSGGFSVVADLTNVQMRTPRRREPHDDDPLTM